MNTLVDFVSGGAKDVRAYVYNHGSEDLFFAESRIKVLNGFPEPGREARAYLTHIVDHYHKLADLTMFIRGNPFTHIHRSWQGGTFAEMAAGCEDAPVQPRHILDEANPPKHHTRIDVHDAARSVLGKAMPVYRFSAGAQYVVSRDRIRSRTLGWWTRVLQLIERDEVNVWEIERLWMYMFGMVQQSQQSQQSQITSSRSATELPRSRRKVTLTDTESFLEHLQRNVSHFEIDATRRVDVQGTLDKHVTTVFDMLDGTNSTPPSLLIDVGSWKGKSAIKFAKHMVKKKGGSSSGSGSGSKKRVLCIDTWLGNTECWTTGISDKSHGGALQHVYGYPSLFYTFLNNVHAHDCADIIVPFPSTSTHAHAALKHYECAADAVYLDASRVCRAKESPGDVLRDAVMYWELVRDGGVLFGSDYDEEHPAVVADVDAFGKEVGLVPELRGTVWFFKKRRAP